MAQEHLRTAVCRCQSGQNVAGGDRGQDEFELPRGQEDATPPEPKTSKDTGRGPLVHWEYLWRGLGM